MPIAPRTCTSLPNTLALGEAANGRPFAAKYPGTCSLSGQRFDSGEKVRHWGGQGLASCAWIERMTFHSPSNGAKIMTSPWVRLDGNLDALLLRVQVGDKIESYNKRGQLSLWQKKADGSFRGIGRTGHATPKQLVARLRRAIALKIEGEAPPDLRKAWIALGSRALQIDGDEYTLRHSSGAARLAAEQTGIYLHIVVNGQRLPIHRPQDGENPHFGDGGEQCDGCGSTADHLVFRAVHLDFVCPTCGELFPLCAGGFLGEDDGEAHGE